MRNSADPDQLASEVGFLEGQHWDLYCLQRQDISRFSRTRVKNHLKRFDTLSGEATLSELFCLTSKGGGGLL